MQQAIDDKRILVLAESGLWEEIQLPEDNLALRKAIELQILPLLGPVLTGDYDLALRRACFSSIKEMIPLLLAGVKNINSVSVKQKNRSALHFAAINGKTDVAVMLLEAGAYVNLCDDDKNTPLHLACAKGHFYLAIELLKRGAYVVYNKSNKTPKMLALENNQTAEIDLYLEEAEKFGKEQSQKPTLGQNNCWVTDCTQASNICFKDALAKKGLLEILQKNRISFMFAEDLICLEREYQVALSDLITQLLTNKERMICINCPQEKLEKVMYALKSKIAIEDCLCVKFEVIFNCFKDSTSFFLKSESAITNDKIANVNPSLYTYDKNKTHLMVGHKNIDAVLTVLGSNFIVKVTKVESAEKAAKC